TGRQKQGVTAPSQAALSGSLNLSLQVLPRRASGGISDTVQAFCGAFGFQGGNRFI
ncbi:unnamed protein product, partial [marine sediment metagenome]